MAGSLEKIKIHCKEGGPKRPIENIHLKLHQNMQKFSSSSAGYEPLPQCIPFPIFCQRYRPLASKSESESARRGFNMIYFHFLILAPCVLKIKTFEECVTKIELLVNN